MPPQRTAGPLPGHPLSSDGSRRLSVNIRPTLHCFSYRRTVSLVWRALDNPCTALLFPPMRSCSILMLQRHVKTVHCTDNVPGTSRSSCAPVMYRCPQRRITSNIQRETCALPGMRSPEKNAYVCRSFSQGPSRKAIALGRTLPAVVQARVWG